MVDEVGASGFGLDWNTSALVIWCKSNAFVNITVRQKEMTALEPISVKDAGLQLGRRKQTIFKVIKRLGIDIQKRRDQSSRNQIVAYISQADFKRVREDMLSSAKSSNDTNEESPLNDTDEFGVFYLIQLEPDHDPGRYKVGFAVNMSDRLRAHRCSAPFSKVIEKWPCKRLWEKTAIDCITANSERLHTEVYRSPSLAEIIERGNSFFGLMPKVKDAK